jgi:hypothetical protein
MTTFVDTVKKVSSTTEEFERYQKQKKKASRGRPASNGPKANK